VLLRRRPRQMTEYLPTVGRPLLAVDWRGLWIPSESPAELILRTSVMYLVILAGFRVFRRDAGSLSVSDLLVVVLIADAAQNGMSADYHSLTEGVVVVGTIFAWNYALDWLAYRFRFVYWLLHPPSLLLIKDGRIQPLNLRAQLLTKEELLVQLREQGAEDVRTVKRCYLESDGRISVIRREEAGHPSPRAHDASGPA
jgi:uncharacterized membrane protein YcaP (DUF421 family)